MKRERRANPVGDLIRQKMKAIGKEDEYLEAVVVNHWEEIAGKAVANNTKNISLYNGVLTITVESSILRDYLSKISSQIKDNINVYVQKYLVDKIEFK